MAATAEHAENCLSDTQVAPLIYEKGGANDRADCSGCSSNNEDSSSRFVHNVYAVIHD